MKKLFLFVAIFLLPLTALSQEYTNYKTSVSFGLKQSKLDVETTLSIPASLITDKQVRLFLNKEFEIVEVSGEGLVDYQVEQSEQIPPWNNITLNFNDSSQSAQTVTFKYTGKIDSSAGHGNFIGEKEVHLSIDSAWHLFFADFSTPQTGALTLELPNGWDVYAPGIISQDNSIFQVNNARPNIDVSLYATHKPNEVVSGDFTVVYDEGNSDNADTVAKAGNRCMSSLNDKFGEKDRLDSAHAVLLERSGPSFARANYISLNSQILKSEPQIYQYLCHELAHNWTAFRSAFSHDYWMVESFAEYIAAKELKEAYGQEAFDTVVSGWKARAEGQAFVWRAEDDRRASHRVNYGLGPLALMQLEEHVGSEAFSELMHWYMTEEVTNTESLLNQLEAIKSEEESRWFKQLLAGHK